MEYENDWTWDYVTQDKLITDQPCELAYAHLVPSGAVTDTYLYHGANTKGEKIVPLVSAAVTGLNFNPAKPIYLPRGLFVDIGSNTTGVFVLWRNRPRNV